MQSAITQFKGKATNRNLAPKYEKQLRIKMETTLNKLAQKNSKSYKEKVEASHSFPVMFFVLACSLHYDKLSFHSAVLSKNITLVPC